MAFYEQTINNKKRVFDDFGIPWNPAIEVEFATETKAHPHDDPEIILDKIARPYIKRKLDDTDVHRASELCAFLKGKYKSVDILYEDTIINILGGDGFKLLMEYERIKPCGKRNGKNMYLMMEV